MTQQVSDAGAARRWALYLTLPSLLWVLVNRSVWPFDPAWYGEVSIDLWLALIERTREWPSMCIAAFGSKAPLIAWLGEFFIPLRYFTGSVEGALLMLMVATSFLALCLAFRINWKLFGTTISGYAGLLTLISAPLFVGLSHEYFAEMLQLACVLWSICIVARASSRVELFFGLLAAATLGLLVKASSPLYMIMPSLIGAWQLIAGNSQRKHCSKARLFWTIAVGICSTVLCVLWYAHNLQTVRDFVASTSSGSIALLYGTSAPFPVKLRLWIHAYRMSFFASRYLGWIWLTLVVVALGLRIKRRTPLKRSDYFTLAATAQIALAVFVFARQTNEETRYLLPLLGYHAIIVGFVVSELRSFLPAILFGSFGIGAAAVQLAAFGFSFGGMETPWLKATDFNYERSEVLAQVVRTTCGPAAAGQYNIIGVEFPWFNANSASFYMLKARLDQSFRCYYTSLGYAENDPTKAFDRMETLHARAVVYPGQFSDRLQDPFNRVSIPIEQKLASDPKVHLQKLGNPTQALIFQLQP